MQHNNNKEDAIVALVERIAALRPTHRWWVRPTGQLRSRVGNLCPLAAYYQHVFRKPAVLERFIEQGNALGLTDAEAVLFTQACDQESPACPDTAALRRYLLEKLIA